MDLPDLPRTEAAIIELTNAFRAENGLADVTPNVALATAAQAFANYLARTGAFAHEADGRKPADRARASGYTFCIVAENLALHQRAKGFQTRELASAAVEGWKNSPPHRAAMLQKHVVDTGIGIARGPEADPKFISVQLFGRPDRLKYQIKIENTTSSTVHYVFANQRMHVPTSTRITHTSCTPSTITFEVASVTSTYETNDGQTFSINQDARGISSVGINGPSSPTAATANADEPTTRPRAPQRATTRVTTKRNARPTAEPGIETGALKAPQ